MTVMQFDSHRGWYNPERPRINVSRSYSSYIEPTYEPKRVAIEKRDFFTLVEQARSGDTEAQAELRLRGNNMSR